MLVRKAFSRCGAINNLQSSASSCPLPVVHSKCPWSSTLVAGLPAVMFDCHAHLTDSSLAEGLHQTLLEAEAAGVTGIVAVSESLDDATPVVELCASINDDASRCRKLRLHPSIGMHPEKADVHKVDDVLELIDKHADTIVCVGEVGLDFSRHLIGESGGERAERAKEVQREVFRRQARRAKELGLAVNVHSRSAGHHAISLLQEEGITRAVLHAFDGKPKDNGLITAEIQQTFRVQEYLATAGGEKERYAVQAAKAGYFFSVPPIVCRSSGFQSLVKALPLESLVLETDSPALGPEKGVGNVPGNLSVSRDWIASLKGVPADVVAETTTANARRLFPRAFDR
ncbi:unnamed protein product [Ectocarpus sp. CCAP 1310/34]|nr:unnamed protein product [Ectocarpus sp. CCAP 1310/34]